MILLNDIFNYTVHLKSLFLHLLVVWSALVMCSCLNEIGHNFENSAKPLFLVPGSEFLLKVFEKNDIFEFFFWSPMAFFFISNMILNGSSMNYKRKWSLFVRSCFFQWCVLFALWSHVKKLIYKKHILLWSQEVLLIPNAWVIYFDLGCIG